MEKRKQQVLEIIIKEHIKTGAPVGSGVLVEKYKLGVSSATIRNEMAALEQAGYIAQPHTSAGRIPTEKAYKLYLDNIKEIKLNRFDLNGIDVFLKEKTEENFKETAKTISGISNNTVIWAFHKYNLYFTGISNLFQQPEFRQIQTVYDISGVIDRIDDIVNDTFDKVSSGITILIGSENPFGEIFSTVLAKYSFQDRQGIVAILGPMRMNYEKNIALIKYIYKQVNKA